MNSYDIIIKYEAMSSTRLVYDRLIKSGVPVSRMMTQFLCMGEVSVHKKTEFREALIRLMSNTCVHGIVVRYSWTTSSGETMVNSVTGMESPKTTLFFGPCIINSAFANALKDAMGKE